MLSSSVGEHAQYSVLGEHVHYLGACSVLHHLYCCYINLQAQEKQNHNVMAAMFSLELAHKLKVTLIL